MPFFRDLATQLNELLAQQTLTKKIVAGFILVAIVAVLSVMMLNFGKTIDYEVLYAGLDEATAKQMKQELTTQGVAYRVTQTDRGWTIQVPSNVVLNTRLDLAGTVDLKGERYGWELFESPKFGMTDFAMRVNRQMAIQGELARTISSFDAISRATVNLAQPEKSPFVVEEKRPTASVLVDLYPGFALSPDQVATIQAIVAGSVEGLDRKDVTVADTLGNELSRATTQNEEGKRLDERERLLTMQERQRKEYEKHLESKILSAFSKVFGQGHVEARVNVDFDFTVREENTLQYSPKNVVRSEQTLKAVSAEQGGAYAEGLIGATKQVGPEILDSGAGAAAGGKGPEYRDEKTVNYEVGRTETKTQYAPYQINKITAAVLVDHIPVRETSGDGGVTEKREELTEEQIAALEDQVKQIIGYSEDRPGGVTDRVSVTSMLFNLEGMPSAVETMSELQKRQWILLSLKWGVWLLVAVLVALFLLRPLARIVAAQPVLQPALAGPSEGIGLPPMVERTVLEGPEEAGLAMGEPEGVPALGMMAPGEAIGSGELRQQSLDNEILELARQNPKKVSLVLRSWMES
ncbi:flagellar M-ring protein FliF [Candidatus Sumerlaeota bacterium]|nr:flagellar M-ring protein FliF [Candidatus Sumerlaeota bacterium]